MAAVNALARECERGDGRTADQRRAHALVVLAVAALHDPRPPRAQGMRPDAQVTDPITGKLLDYRRTTYRPPVDLADFVIARDGTCTFTGCGRSARHGDLDHETPYDADGVTNPANLAAMCRRHHRLKHESGWSVTRDPQTCESTWTSPTGHRYQSRPEPYPADRTARSAIRIRRLSSSWVAGA